MKVTSVIFDISFEDFISHIHFINWNSDGLVIPHGHQHLLVQFPSDIRQIFISASNVSSRAEGASEFSWPPPYRSEQRRPILSLSSIYSVLLVECPCEWLLLCHELVIFILLASTQSLQCRRSLLTLSLSLGLCQENVFRLLLLLASCTTIYHSIALMSPLAVVMDVDRQWDRTTILMHVSARVEISRTTSNASCDDDYLCVGVCVW